MLAYRDGQVTLERVKAEHGGRNGRRGGLRYQADGSWRLRLQDLAIDRLPLDRELVQALPSRLRRVLTDLNLVGPVNLRGLVEFQRGGRASDLLESSWDVKVGFQRGSMDCGVKLDNLYGEVGLTGYFDGENLRSRGELSVDSLTFKDLQLTQIRGPLWIDDQQVLFGAWVDRPRQGGRTATQAAAAQQPALADGRRTGGNASMATDR